MKADELVCEVESDKAVVEVNSPVDGIVKEYFIKEGAEVDLDLTSEICSIEESVGGAPAAPSP